MAVRLKWAISSDKKPWEGKFFRITDTMAGSEAKSTCVTGLSGVLKETRRIRRAPRSTCRPPARRACLVTRAKSLKRGGFIVNPCEPGLGSCHPSWTPSLYGCDEFHFDGAWRRFENRST